MESADSNAVLHRLPENVINSLNESEWTSKFKSWNEKLFPTFITEENYFNLEKSESSGYGNTELDDDMGFLV